MYQKAAEQGNAGAQFNLGFCYYRGVGVGVNHKQTIYWYQKAAAQGDASAQYHLGVFYQNGSCGMIKCLAVAVVYYQAAANQGHKKAITRLANMGEALIKANNLTSKSEPSTVADLDDPVVQNKIGMLYQDSNEYTDKNNEAAFKWFQLAAKQGNILAQNYLGFCFGQGNGVNKNDQLSFYWYQQAAKQGDAGAQNRIGVCFARGLGVGKDDRQAFDWLQKAAKQDFSAAQFNLSLLYFNGTGVVKCLAVAIMYCQSAANKNYQGAVDRLAKIDKAIIEASKLTSKPGPATAADLDDPEVQYKIGMLYQSGNKYTSKSDQAAVYWLQLASKQEHALAQFRLGLCYRDGIGVNKNQALAKQWLEKSKLNKCPEAVQVLASIELAANTAPGEKTNETQSFSERRFK